MTSMAIYVKIWTSEATPSATHFFKGSYKISHPIDYKRSLMLWLALQHRQKVPKEDFQSEFSMSKITWTLKPLYLLKLWLIFYDAAQCPRTDLNKRFLPRSKSITVWKLIPIGLKSARIEIPHSGSH